MRNLFLCLCYLMLTRVAGFSQEKIAEFGSLPGYTKNDDAAGYYLPASKQYVIHLQQGEQVTRFLYDAQFKPLQSYTDTLVDLTYGKARSGKAIFALNTQVDGKNYEVFADKSTIIVLSVDFETRQDSVYWELDIGRKRKEEQRMAIIPHEKGIRVLTYLQKKNALKLYDWKGPGILDSFMTELPASTLSEEETRQYTRDARIIYRKSFDEMFVAGSHRENLFLNPGANVIYYSDEKIWLLSQTPFFTGYNILELDIATASIRSRNIFINDMRKNNTALPPQMFRCFAAIADSLLIIRNASFNDFEYHFYNLYSLEKKREFHYRGNDSLRKILHSALQQRGTWISGKGEKQLDNENTFLRRINSDMGFIGLSELTADSVTLTTGGYQLRSGPGQQLFSFSTFMLGSMTNIRIGNVQIIPYLEFYRKILLYAHSRFSLKTLEPSAHVSITTPLDHILDNFEKRDLKASSSFLIKVNDHYLVSLFNPETRQFECYKL